MAQARDTPRVLTAAELRGIIRCLLINFVLLLMGGWLICIIVWVKVYRWFSCFRLEGTLSCLIFGVVFFLVFNVFKSVWVFLAIHLALLAVLMVDLLFSRLKLFF